MVEGSPISNISSTLLDRSLGSRIRTHALITLESAINARRAPVNQIEDLVKVGLAFPRLAELSSQGCTDSFRDKFKILAADIGTLKSEGDPILQQAVDRVVSTGIQLFPEIKSTEESC